MQQKDTPPVIGDAVPGETLPDHRTKDAEYIGIEIMKETVTPPSRPETPATDSVSIFTRIRRFFHR